MNYWVEKTVVHGREDRIDGERSLGNALWSPRRDKKGADIYSNMRDVQPGDVIFHLIDNSQIIGISKANSFAEETDGLLNTSWEGPAYLVRLTNFERLNPAISRQDLLNEANKPILDKIRNESEVFYTRNYELRQGAYLTPCPIKLVELLNRIYNEISNRNLPHVQLLDLTTIKFSNEMEINIEKASDSISSSGLLFSKLILTRFIAALLTKPFSILTGLSGSGKTKLAEAFVKWICQDDNQYEIIPVGADWTNREPLLGYPNALSALEYVKPETGALDLILKAIKNEHLPYFLILDEMNLSHVERYFADFLSVMETKGDIVFFSGEGKRSEVPSRVKFPPNLFIIGTVNIDETTNMFSPKVLDRANTIEFRLTNTEMEKFLKNIKEVNIEVLKGEGAKMANSFLEMASNKSFVIDEKINTILVKFFNELKKTGAEFGYRSATEILRLIHHLSVLDSELSMNQKIDIAIMQKLLPKLHGSRRKLIHILEALGSLCIEGDLELVKEVFENDDFKFNSKSVLFPLSLEKIARMYRRAVQNGFASYAEA